MLSESSIEAVPRRKLMVQAFRHIEKRVLSTPLSGSGELAPLITYWLKRPSSTIGKPSPKILFPSKENANLSRRQLTL
jgi:hypothetical protein